MVPSQKRIMIVDDDDASIRRVLSRILRETLIIRDHVIEEAETAGDALSRILDCPEDKWFVMTDNNMPSKNGYEVRNGIEFIRRVRGHAPRISATLILMSSGITSDVLSTVHADAFLHKPFDAYDVERTVLSLYSRFLASE